jgi:predicted nucleic acid-binding protein
MNLLDTDAVVQLLRERRYEVGAISIVTLIEVLRGLEANKRAKVKELLEESFSVLDLSNEIIEAYCTLCHKLKEKGTLIPDADLLIAATAMSHGTPLKTKGEHFERLTHLGLKLTRTRASL